MVEIEVNIYVAENMVTERTMKSGIIGKEVRWIGCIGQKFVIQQKRMAVSTELWGPPTFTRNGGWNPIDSDGSGSFTEDPKCSRYESEETRSWASFPVDVCAKLGRWLWRYRAGQEIFPSLASALDVECRE